MSKKKTKPKKPKAPKTAPPTQEYSVSPPKPAIDKTPPKKLVPPVKTPTYDCLKSDKELTFYLVEVNGPKSSIGSGPFTFKYSPQKVSWKKQVGVSEYKTQGNTEQPLYFTAGQNKKLQLQEIIFDGHDGTHVLPHDQLNRLQVLQLPAKGTTKLRVFQLLVGNVSNKSFSARSYGKFVISSLDIAEVFRDPSTGLTLRAKVNLELTEVAAYQLDLGNDLAIPTSIVPTLPKELGSPLSSLGPTLSNVVNNQEVGGAIPAGAVIAYIGSRYIRPILPHLHYEFKYKDETYQAAAKRYTATATGVWKTYPKEILDLISLGPYSKNGVKSPILKLSEVTKRIQSGELGSPRPARKGIHEGVDYALPGFEGELSRGTPITINVNCFYKGERSAAAGSYEFEGTLNGKEFVITITHIDKGGLAQVANTANKRPLSTNPQNKGGNTTTATKKANSDPKPPLLDSGQ